MLPHPVKKKYWLLLAVGFGLLAAQNGWAFFTQVRYTAGDGYSIVYFIVRVAWLLALMVTTALCIVRYRRASS